MAHQLEQAHAAAAALAAVPGVIAVCLFGSLARGTAGPSSDIDLLVLGSSQELTPSSLQDRAAPEVQDAQLTLSYYTQSSLREYLRRWSRFGAHLRAEAVILHDPQDELRDLLAEEIPVSVDLELQAQREHLAGYSRVERFGGRLLFPLAHVYSIGRTVVYALLADRGQLEFDRGTAFTEILRIEPGLAREIAIIQELAPFYDRVRNKERSAALPFSPTGHQAESKFIQARDAVARLLSRPAQAR